MDKTQIRHCTSTKESFLDDVENGCSPLLVRVSVKGHYREETQPLRNLTSS